MTSFSVINKAPGVFIQEINVSGPIPGVGTSTAAFIGPAEQGPINKPTLLTSFPQFQDTFGGFITAPMVYVAHAVQGFFDNGGTACYFVRVGTAAKASLLLEDRASPANPTLVVTARQEGVASNAITVEVQESSIVPTLNVVRVQRPLINASNNQATVTDAEDFFQINDIVLLEQPPGEGETEPTSERATIASISDSTIVFRANLNNIYTGGTIRIANLELGQQQIRVASTEGIYPGTYIRITQEQEGEIVTDVGVVQAVAQQFVTLTQGLSNTYLLAASNSATTLQTLEFTLIVTTPDSLENIDNQDIGSRRFENLSLDPRHPNYFARIVESSSVEVVLADPPTPTAPPNNLPAVIPATALTGGREDNITEILNNASNFISALPELEKVDDINILCIPDNTVLDVQAAMIAHCEKMQDRFAILDPARNAAPDPTPASGIGQQRSLLTSDNGFAALYYPWIFISNPTSTGQIKVPPSGHIAGVYARTDTRRGVSKAPANESLRGVLALEQTFTENQIGLFNEQSINVLRALPGRGSLIWGARTISTFTQWRYINVRRLLLFIEESIQEGTQFAVFEPNNLELRQRVVRQVTEFLTRVWRDGALFGATPEQAFRVRADEQLNPPDIRALGQLVIEVVVVPTTPAEFIVFRVIQDPTGASLQE